MSHSIKALIFDFDGVITDTAEYHYQSWKRLADEEGLHFNRELNDQLRGVTRRESLRRLLNGRHIDEATIIAWMQRKNDYFHEFLNGFTAEHRLPGITRILEQAKQQGIKLGIASASRNVRPALEKLELTAMFDAIGDPAIVVNNKPAYDVFVWTAGALGVGVRQAIVFEDSDGGIDAARNAGFYTVGLGTANVSHADLSFPDLADVQLDDLITQLLAKSS